MEIYDAIVNGFKGNIPANTGIAAYLQSLQKSVKSLRIAYRNSIVIVPYEKTDIQAAYLATYLPHYYQLIYNAPVTQTPSSFSMLNAGSSFNPNENGYLKNTGSGENYEAWHIIAIGLIVGK